jgi:very-short-patch-repair endonuclease
VKLLRHRDAIPPSRLERKFLHYWRVLGGPELTPEFRFHAGRKWRADFAHIESQTLIEIEGGIYLAGGGRHNRAVGFAADTEKYLEAALAGWRVLRLTDRQITAAIIERIIALIRNSPGVKLV